MGIMIISLKGCVRKWHDLRGTVRSWHLIERDWGESWRWSA